MLLLQVSGEEFIQFVERNQRYPVVKIHMARSRDDIEFFRLRSQLVGVFTEITGMGPLAGDEQYRTRRNQFDIREWEKFIIGALLV